MFVILQIVTIILSIYIINNTGKNRIVAFYCGVFFLRASLYVVQSPGISAHTLLLLSFFASLFKNDRHIWDTLPWKRLFVINVVILFVLGLLTSHYSFFHKIYRPFLFSLTEVGSILIGFASIRTLSDGKLLFKVITYIALISCVYGVIVFITNYNPYDAIMINYIDPEQVELDFDINNTNGRGVRLNGVVGNSHIWGFVCTLFFLVVFWGRKYVKIPYEWPVLLIILSNVFLSKSRSSIICLAVGMLITLMFYGKVKNQFSVLISFGILVLIIFEMNFIDIRFLSDLFDKTGGDTGGSSVDMRVLQYDSALYFFSQNPIWGNGLEFFHRVLLRSTAYDVSVMGGFESCVYSFLMERGLIYIVFIIIFTIVIYSLFVNYRTNNYIACLGAGILSAYWFNAIVTGDSGKTIYAYLLVGALIKLSILIKSEEYDYKKTAR